MKFLGVALAAFLASVTADMPTEALLKKYGIPKTTAWKVGGDMILNAQQESCFFDKNPPAEMNCTGGQDRTGFDKSVKPWRQYHNPDKGSYMIPMLVNIKSFKKEQRKVAWKSFLWVKKQFNDHTNIDLQFIDEYEQKTFFPEGYLAPFNGGSCWSAVGNVDDFGPGQKMDLGWCHPIQGSILHETMHALGFVHEHSRHDRDDYIQATSVYPDKQAKINCGKYERGQLDTSGTDYDFESIMHYGEGPCGIQVKQEYQQFRSKLGQREYLSATDVKGINDIYPAHPELTVG